MKSVNPHHPSETVWEGEASRSEGVEEAVERARAAFEPWSGLPAPARGDALRRIGDSLEDASGRLVELTVREVGKPVMEARQEVARAVAIFRYYAQLAVTQRGEDYPSADGRSWLLSRRNPLGVCALLTPWNFPVAIPAWKIAPALGFGDTAIFKPAPQSAAIGNLLHEMAATHLPDGVLEIVHGDAETGRPLTAHPGVDAISFTGSVEVGHEVAGAAARRGVKVQCEMGGQNPSVVLADADLERGAETIAFAAMGYAGQKCTATSRVIVEDRVYEPFKGRLVAAVEAMQVVDPGAEDCRVGPVIERAARDAAMDAIAAADGVVLTGGKELDAVGFYLAPTLVEVKDPTSLLATKEVFGPVAALMRAASQEEAIEIANATDYGLVASVFTADLERAMTSLDRLKAGLVRTNAPTSGVDFHVPFGGTKASSYGPREQGTAARDFYTESQTLLVSP